VTGCDHTPAVYQNDAFSITHTRMRSRHICDTFPQLRQLGTRLAVRARGILGIPRVRMTRHTYISRQKRLFTVSTHILLGGFVYGLRFQTRIGFALGMQSSGSSFDIIKYILQDKDEAGNYGVVTSTRKRRRTRRTRRRGRDGTSTCGTSNRRIEDGARRAGDSSRPQHETTRDLLVVVVVTNLAANDSIETLGGFAECVVDVALEVADGTLRCL